MSDITHAQDTVCGRCGFMYYEHMVTTGGDDDGLEHIMGHDGCPGGLGITFRPATEEEKAKNIICANCGHKFRNHGTTGVPPSVVGRTPNNIGIKPDIHYWCPGVATTEFKDPVPVVELKIEKAKIKKDKEHEQVTQALDVAVERLVVYENPIRLADRKKSITANEVKNNLFLEVDKTRRAKLQE